MGRLSAAEQRARAVLNRLPDGPVVGAEVGVYDGRMSAHLLTRSDLTLYMVDRWAAPLPSYAASGDPLAALKGDAMLRAMSDARDAVAYAGGRARMVREDSQAATLRIDAGSLDFAFIDAEHTEEAVRRDIVAWLPTLKPGGLLCGHDYGDERYGVSRAVDEACERFGWVLDLGADKTWFVRP